MKSILVQASSRSNGNTNTIVKALSNFIDFHFLDLSLYSISQYDYENKNKDDDALSVIQEIAKYDIIIFATPVYWYAMSGILKTFFDRLTTCLKSEKNLGRKLRGKSIGAISCGSDDDEVEGFFVPFKSTAVYLGMNYLGNVHTWTEDKEPTTEVLSLIEDFSEKINKA